MKRNNKKKREIIKKAKTFLISHRRAALIIVLSVLLSAGVRMRDRADAQGTAGVVERGAEGQSTQSRTFTFRLEESGESDQGDTDGEEQTITEEHELELDVASVQRSEEETLALLEEAVAEWEEAYLGENDSADEVRQDLNLSASACEGLVEISYTSSNTEILKEDGTVLTDAVAEDGEVAELTVRFECGDYLRIETYAVRILPPEEGSAEWAIQELEKEARQTEEESREQNRFSLPDSVAGYRVVWAEDENYQWMFILLIGAAAAVCLERKEKQDEKERQKKRREQLEFEYPQMVDRFAVLLDSGMTIRKAWERILAGERRTGRGRGGARPKESVFMEEMWITYREIREGRGEREAYERFGNRIGLMPYRRFGSILAQNLSRGTRDIRELLQKESEDALEMRRNRARKMGEEAGSKLLFPMLVMLVLILVVLLLPALTSM